ncbi:ABC transporter permease [Phaeacidiphilus oryzae]|jgi:peptide/nickel transport system permease protein|uniref:ABC transporter permease n=1 Tax=Phaeacidiphilus oryzae TaxID=348818 RepID=UPI0005606C45|nr:ABC transporter permease [Phaeacidiphilus oryzae]
MTRFLVRRILGALVILFLILFITYTAFFVLAPNPALLSCGKNCTPQNIALINHNLGFDKPVAVQFWDYLKGIFAGRNDLSVGPCPAPCFGYSFAQQQPIWTMIKSAYPTTLSLAVGGGFCFFVIGMGLGLIAAWRQGTLTDSAARAISLVGLSTQIYFIGPLAILVFADKLGWVSAGADPDWTHDPLGSLDGLILPCLVLSVIFWGNYTRQIRSQMIEQLHEDHIRTARAKGMSPSYVFFRYALRGTMAPMLTVFGIDLGQVFGGAIITEVTFGLHGLGHLSVEAVLQADLPLEMGVTLFAATAIITANVIVDASYALLDPRVRLT